ncbi:K(+)/H(+) antiporter, partial [Dimargaris verticillata]
ESDHSDEALDSTKSKAKATNAEPTTALAHFKALRVHALRLVALTQRNSAVMMYADAERTMELDPLVGMFRTFGRLNGISVRTGLHLCPVENFAEALSDKANMVHANYTIVPWSGYEDVSEDAAANTPSGSGGGALDYLFPRTPRSAQGTSPQQLQFITDVFVHSLGNVVVFLDRGFDRSGSSHGHGDSAGPVGNLGTMPVDLTTHSQYHQHSLGVGGPGGITAWRYVAHVVVPFFGGRDDRAAVHMALQFAANHGIKVTIARFIHVLDPTDNDAALGTADFIEASNQMTVMRSEQLAALPRAMVTGTLNNHPANVQSTVPQHQRTTIRLQSEQEDEALFNMLFQGSSVPEDEEALAESTSFTLTHYPNVTLELVETSTPLQTAIVKYRKLASHDLIVLGRGKDSGPGHRAEIEALLAVDGSHANNLYGSPNSGLSTSDGGYQPVDPDYADYKGTSPEAPGSAEAPILARQQNPKYGMLGDAAERFLAANCSSSLMVVQGRRSQ